MRLLLVALLLLYLLASNWGWFRVQEDVLTPQQMLDASAPLQQDSSPSTDWVAAGDKFRGGR